MNVKNITKVKRRGRNIIGVEFSRLQSANEFLKNKHLIEKGYKLYTIQHGNM